MANATYEFMRANANATEEMRQVLEAKAVNVQVAVPPTLAAGDWSVGSEGDGEGSSVDLHDGVSCCTRRHTVRDGVGVCSYQAVQHTPESDPEPLAPRIKKIERIEKDISWSYLVI